MLYIEDQKFEYSICSYSKTTKNDFVIIHIGDTENVILSEKEYQIWLLIVDDYNNQIDISDIVLSKQFCENYGVALNDLSNIIRDVRRAFVKFIKHGMIILL